MSAKNLIAAGLAAAVLPVLAGCGAPAEQPEPAPATLKAVPGSPVKEVRLTQRAMQRVGIATQPVQSAEVRLSGKDVARTVIPYSAVVYDTDGSTWTYVSTAARTFLREPIDVSAIEGSVAVLNSGPAVGAAVVTVGAPELLGTEYQISGEE